jgi:hypothetical protein
MRRLSPSAQENYMLAYLLGREANEVDGVS